MKKEDVRSIEVLADDEARDRAEFFAIDVEQRPSRKRYRII